MTRSHEPWTDDEIDRLVQSSLNVQPSASFLARVRAAVAETTVDQEIQDALNIEPSPTFVARVRQRLEQDSSPTYVESVGQHMKSSFSRGGQSVASGFSRILSRPWTLAAGALAAAAAISAVVVINRPPARQTPVRVVSSIEAASGPPASPPVAQEASRFATPTPLMSAVTESTAQAASKVHVSLDSNAGSEVIVSREEIRAFRQYLSSLDPDAFKATTMVERSAETAPLPAVQHIAIDPIVVDPINTSTE